YTQMVTISTDDHHTLQEFRASVGAQWTFLSDPGRTVQKDLDIQEYTDPEHDPMIPHTLVANSRSWLRYSFTDRTAATEARPASAAEKSCGRNRATRRTRPRRPLGGSAVRTRPLSPSASSPPTWSTCKWVITASVTDAGSMPAASSRMVNRPTPGEF